MSHKGELGQLESEIERLWMTSNAKVAALGKTDKIQEEIAELIRGGALYECLELVRKAQRNI